MVDAPKTKSRTFAAPLSQLELPSLEESILGLWKANGVEGRSLRRGVPQSDVDAGSEATGSTAPAFVFYDGPPFATGLPHYGHLLAGTIKDIVPRYWSMRGYGVERRFGWDCHGLPIETIVEDRLGVHGRIEIEELGVPRFNAACRAGVLEFTAEWERVVSRMGRWVDFENDYKTMDPSFMESVWWVFKQLWDKELIYEGHRVSPVSPALGTPLSNFEVAQGPQEKDPVTRKEGHKRRQDPSVTVRFALEDEEGAYLWAWTTTPWTLPSNLALAVHPQVEYAKVRFKESGEVAYLEPGRLADYLARERVGEFEELERMPGSKLVGRPYAPLLPYFEQYREREDGSRWAFRVVSAQYVTTESGTGIVHQAPAFGEDDYIIGRENGLPLVNPLSLNGIFDESVPDFAGVFAKDADKAIVAMLKAEGKLVDHDTIVHAYPHCYRTDQPLLYMAISTWFMKVEEQREELVANNKKIRWVPEHVGSGRFGNWLSNARDWNLSRNRYWGTPLPVWRCDEDPSDMVCIGSRAELAELAGLDPASLDDLHREYIDEITFPSKKTKGGTMRRVQEVFDCWFESGSMPYAQNHYPFDESRKDYVEQNLPADFIAEGLDQTRGWFYTLHVLSNALFGRPAFKNVIVNGLILAADGKKMSKRLKNYPDPSLVIKDHGADALRAYLINSPVVRAEPMRFGKHAKDTSGEAVRDTVRTVILPLWNSYNFLVTYARADGWSPADADLDATPKNTLDRWVLSRLQSFLANLNREYEAYSLYNLVPAYLELCDDLNNWYIRRGRRRYWSKTGQSEAGDADKAQAYATLYRVLCAVSHAMAPVLPFFSEFLYQRLVVDLGLAAKEDGDSVHMRPMPQAVESLSDEGLEAQVATARKVVNLGLTLREGERIGVRRPLASLTVASRDPEIRAAVEAFSAEISAELNVKSVEVAEDDAELVELSVKANFKVLGKRLGKDMKLVAKGINQLDSHQSGALQAGKTLEIEGFPIASTDVLFVRQPKDGMVVGSEDGITVVLDSELTEPLRLEGLMRELVNRVQNLRKSAGFEVSDFVNLTLTLDADTELAKAIGTHELQLQLQTETLTETLFFASEAPEGESVHSLKDEIDGEAITVSVEVVV